MACLSSIPLQNFWLHALLHESKHMYWSSLHSQTKGAVMKRSSRSLIGNYFGVQAKQLNVEVTINSDYMYTWPASSDLCFYIVLYSRASSLHVFELGKLNYYLNSLISQEYGRDFWWRSFWIWWVWKRSWAWQLGASWTASGNYWWKQFWEWMYRMALRINVQICSTSSKYSCLQSTSAWWHWLLWLQRMCFESRESIVISVTGVKCPLKIWKEVGEHFLLAGMKDFKGFCYFA